MEKSSISTEDFDKLIDSDKLVFVDFFAEWCGPCQMMSPIIDELHKEYEGNDKIEILKIDVDENPEISSKYDVMSIPTFLFVKNNNVIEQLTGATSKDILKSKIEENIK